MKSLDTGESPLRNVRVPDELWHRFELWAARQGQSDSDALRSLIERSALQVSGAAVVLKPPTAWMASPKSGAPGMMFATVQGRSNWWDLDELLKISSGNREVHPRGRRGFWRPFPPENLPTVLKAFAGQEHRLKIHHPEKGEGPRLSTGTFQALDTPTEDGTN